MDEDQTILTLLRERDEAWRLLTVWRTALQRIANDNSGPWGWIAKEALDQEKKMTR